MSYLLSMTVLTAVIWVSPGLVLAADEPRGPASRIGEDAGAPAEVRGSAGESTPARPEEAQRPPGSGSARRPQRPFVPSQKLDADSPVSLPSDI